MLYLFILESIGTSELMLIGLVALIVFGPRKIPELARTVGKFMAEFRRSTDDFKKTWEKEAGLDEGETFGGKINKFLEVPELSENSIKSENADQENNLFAPEIKEIDYQDFEKANPPKQIQKTEETKTDFAGKRDWL